MDNQKDSGYDIILFGGTDTTWLKSKLSDKTKVFCNETINLPQVAGQLGLSMFSRYADVFQNADRVLVNGCSEQILEMLLFAVKPFANISVINGTNDRPVDSWDFYSTIHFKNLSVEFKGTEA